MEKKYYLAYDERYKKVHQQGLLWFFDSHSPELEEWINHYGIPREETICEVGCGEGRDAIYIAGLGYNVTAADVSPAAIQKCRELAAGKGIDIDWRVSDGLSIVRDLDTHFKWIYSVATLHMLVEDEDRSAFLSSLYELLEPRGKLLLVNMGDGTAERHTDTSAAFAESERNYRDTEIKMQLASTSYRSINWENHRKELEAAGFIIEKTLNTQNENYMNCMTVYLSKP